MLLKQIAQPEEDEEEELLEEDELEEEDDEPPEEPPEELSQVPTLVPSVPMQHGGTLLLQIRVVPSSLQHCTGSVPVEGQS